MADHFALMTGRLLTESTLQSAVHEAFADAVASTATGSDQTDTSVVLPEDVQLDMGMGKGKAKSGVMVECRICQEEGDEAYMETPCSCKGSLKIFVLPHKRKLYLNQFVAGCSTLTTDASSGGVTRRETPYVRYACSN